MLHCFRRPAVRTPSLSPSGCITTSSSRAFAWSSSDVPFPVQRISKEEFAARRHTFFQHMTPNSIVILPAADETIATRDILNEFRQDSMLYHLFGLAEPMRRSLSPPHTSTEDENFKLTCAVLAKFDGTQTTPGKTTTQLFVPRKTTNLSVLPWSEESRTLGDFHREIFAETGTSDPTAQQVRGNDLESILDVLIALVSDMTRHAWAHRGQNLVDGIRSSGMKRSILKDGNPLPRMYVNLPQQLRWTGEVFHLPQSHDKRGSHTVKAQAVFRHPLEALMHALYALEMKGQCPASDGVAADTHIAFCCRYQQPSGRSLLPGIRLPSVQEQTTLQRLYPHILLHFGSTHGNAHGEISGEVASTLPDNSPAHLASAPGIPTTQVSLSSPIQLPTRLFDEYRARKGPSQVAQHVCSAMATHVALLSVMRAAQHTTCERTLESAFFTALRAVSSACGEERTRVASAYLPVVAVGGSATQIHYTRNDQVGQPGDLCRVDAGAELDQVPTDCTRTFPVGSAEDFWVNQQSAKRALYDGVIAVQRALLQRVRHGVELFYISESHLTLSAALVEELFSCEEVQGAGKDKPKDNVSAAVRKVLCAHSFGHPFGLDIHETHPPPPMTKGSRRTLLTGGMMITVEPGLYIPSLRSPLWDSLVDLLGAQAAQGLEELHGVGVQVEDDVLVLPPSTAGHARVACDGCLWSRAEYLAYVLRVYDRLEATNAPDFFLRDGYGDEVEERLWCHYRTELPRQQWLALLLVFLQRVSLEGARAAQSGLARDAARIQEHLPCSAEGRSDAWYPFEVLVLTAFTPKDVSVLERVIKAS